MIKKAISKGVIKDIIIVAIAILVIWIGLQAFFGTQNPFYVVASGSMIPVLEVYDVLVIQGHDPFEEVEIGDIIVFDRPSDHNRVIVHRVVSIIDDNPKTIRTQGDANPKSIPGTDFPITEEEYIGKVEHVLPQVGYITQLLKPPVNYIIIAVVIGIMILKQFSKKKKESPMLKNLQDSDDVNSDDVNSDDVNSDDVNSDDVNSDDVNSDSFKELSDINKIEKDSEYSEHVEKSDLVVDDKDESENLKTDESEEE
ncbi:MAG TPA: signal peptidase I [Nitrosopumilus sp.]|nr:signal peptidase I [Nitrosopumilus sp.]